MKLDDNKGRVELMYTRIGLRSDGFTLIELLVVIVIIGLLAGIGISSFQGALAKSRNSKRRADLKEVNDALKRYWIDNGSYPSTGGAPVWWSSEPGDVATNNGGVYIPSLVPDYLELLPRDPSGGASTIQPTCGNWKQAFLYASDGTAYKLMAHCSIEGGVSANDPLADPARSTYAIMYCAGAGCAW